MACWPNLGLELVSRVAGGSADAVTCEAEASPPSTGRRPKSRQRRGRGRTNCVGRAGERARSEKGESDRGRDEEEGGEKVGQEQKGDDEEKDPRRIWKGSDEEQGMQMGMEEGESTG